MEKKKKKLCSVPPKPPAKNSRVCVCVFVPAEEVFCGGRKNLVLVMDDLPSVCAGTHTIVSHASHFVSSLKVR